MIRIEYDEVIAYHRYREDGPWDRGMLLVHIDAINGTRDEADAAGREVRLLEDRMIRGAHDVGLTEARKDNHYGFTLMSPTGGL